MFSFNGKTLYITWAKQICRGGDSCSRQKVSFAARLADFKPFLADDKEGKLQPIYYVLFCIGP